MLTQLYEKHPDEVRTVFRHFPLPSHPLALKAAYASEAAGLQGKFWEMEELIFAQQGNWGAMTDEQFQDWVIEQAETLELDGEKFLDDMNSQAVTEKVDAAQQRALEIGLPGTPFLLINGQPYDGSRDLGSLESIMELFKLEKRQITYCPPMQIDPTKQYIATIQTEKGDVKLQLFPDKAPMAVNSFVFLARNGWFDDITFHRVVKNFVAQAGDPSGSGFGGPGYSFDNEISDLKFDKAGMVGMANAGPGSNGSQFFITYAAAPNLDGNYTVFGEVIEGMEVLQQLTDRDPQANPGAPPGDTITTITIEEK